MSDLPAVPYTAPCPCGNPDAQWSSVLVPRVHELSRALAVVVESVVDCDVCDPLGEAA